MLCIVSHGKRHAVYRVSWKDMLGIWSHGKNASYLVWWKQNSWYPVLWKIMLGSWSHEMICIMSGGNPSLVSCLIKKMLGIMSHGNTCLVS